MLIKNNVKEIHLKIDNFIPFVGEYHTGFIIQWSSDIGLGEYTIYKSKENDKWYGDSEHMDNNNNKEFISELLKLFIEQLNIE